MKITTSEEFIKQAIDAVYEMAADMLCKTDNVKFTRNDVYVVSHSFVLFAQKAMLSTTLPDNKYYEVTYNPAKEEMYVDCYLKVNYQVLK